MYNNSPVPVEIGRVNLLAGAAVARIALHTKSSVVYDQPGTGARYLYWEEIAADPAKSPPSPSLSRHPTLSKSSAADGTAPRGKCSNRQ